MMIVQVLDRLLILCAFYFLYMLLFHLPSRCDDISPPPLPPAVSPPSSDTFFPTYPPNEKVDYDICPNDGMI